MTTPRFAPCRCAHSKDDHDREGFAPQCTAPSCTCLAYRPDVARNVQQASPLRTVQPLGSGPRSMVHEPPRESSDDEVLRGKAPTIEQILAAGKRSAHKRTVALTEKIAEQIHDLRGRLADEREASEEARREAEIREQARKQVAELEKQLAAARALLRGGPVSPGGTRSISGESLPCTQPGCARVFSRPQGLSRHMNESHGIVRGGAA